MPTWLGAGAAAEARAGADAMAQQGYGATTLPQRVAVLQELADRLGRRLLEDAAEGPAESEDQCKACDGEGELVCCEMCPSVFHPACAGLEAVPDDAWFCPVCQTFACPGVSDSLPPGRDPLRGGTRLGVDRSGRSWIFAARRVFVLTEDEDCVYYSRPEHLTPLKDCLDRRHEPELLTAFRYYTEEMRRQMAQTVTLTVSRTPPARPSPIGASSRCRPKPSPG